MSIPSNPFANPITGPGPKPAPKARKFETPTLALDVPEGWSDQSMYILAGPEIRHFRTTLIVKRNPAVKEADLGAHVDAQMLELAQLGEFRLISRGPVGEIEQPREALDFEWTQRGTRLRQRQHYVWYRGDVFTLTATARAADFAEVAPQVDSIMASFKPRNWGVP